MLRSVILSLLLLSVVIPNVGQSYETDQYSYLEHDLTDSVPVLDELVNRGIKHIAESWEGERDDKLFAVRVARLFSSRQLERWVNTTDLIESVNDKASSVYRTTSFYQSPIIRMKGLASTYNMAGVHVGADKMSHFFGVGNILFRMAEMKHASRPLQVRMRKALRHSKFTEEMYWGELTTNVFSNADLVVNYEGYLFFRSLYEDGVVEGKPSILGWEGNRPFIKRAFTFNDHVNDYWSEAMNPNRYQFFLAKKVRGVLRKYCLTGYYEKHKDRLVSPQDEELAKKYSHIFLKGRGQKFRMDNVCEEVSKWSSEKQKRFLERQTKLEEKFHKKMIDSGLVNNSNVSIEDIVKKTGMPTCKSKMTKAMTEHDALMEVVANERTNTPLDFSLILRRVLEVHPSLIFTAVGLNGSYTYKKVFESPEGREVRVFTNNDKNEEWVLSRYRSGHARVCREVSVDFGEKKVRKDVVLKYKHCLDTNGTEKEFYDFKKGSATRTSVEDFQGLENLRTYVYRTVPMLCRWY